MRPAMILFAKAPIPGRVKTRLARRLGAAAAAELHRAFVLDTYGWLQTLSDCVDVEIHSDVPTDAWPVARFQPEGNLGTRMYHALSTALDGGRPQAGIVGADSPTLPPKHLRSLLDSPADVAIGPTEDGGYYAIVCRRVHFAMFRGVPWSTKRALTATERSAASCGLTTARGPLWYDVDEVADLERLLSGPLPPRTAAWKLRFLGE